jgi:hypothetical protein
MVSSPAPRTEEAAETARYEDFSARQSREARTEWETFLASRTPAQIAELKRLGITGFTDDREHIGPPDTNKPAPLTASDRPIGRENLRVDVDFSARCDTRADEIAERWKITHDIAAQIAKDEAEMIEREVERRKAEQLQTIAAFMIAPGNARKRALGLAYVANLDALNGIGSQEMAGKQTLSTRASINAEAIKWRDLFGLPQNGHMKADAARGTYSKDKASSNHWRRKKYHQKNPKTAKT